jgi:hypothetical protein
MEEEEREENDESTDGAKQRVVRSGLPDLSIAALLRREKDEPTPAGTSS